MKGKRFILALAIVQLSAASTALANIPVFEAYIGPRPTKEPAAVTAFLSDLEKASPGLFASAKRLQGAFGARLPLPGSDPSLTAADFTRRLEQADATWIRQPALSVLLPALASAVEVGKTNPAYLVSDPGRREVFRRVLLAYALALKRNGDIQPSQDAMAEWIRTFPDQVITRARAGSDAEQLYQDARQALATRGRGTLTINLSETNLQLYVNEVIRRPAVPLNDLLPGVYRVLIVDHYNRSRRYALEVLASQDSVLNVDWAIESRLRVTPSFIGFELDSAAELAHAGQPIARFAQAAIGAPGTILVTLGKNDHDQLVTAETYSPSHAEPKSSASIVISGNSRSDNERAASLALYLVDHTPQPDVIVNPREPEAAPTVAKATHSKSVASGAIDPLPPARANIKVAGSASEPAPPAPQTWSPTTPPPVIATPVSAATTSALPPAISDGRRSMLPPLLLLSGGLALGGVSLYVGSSTTSTVLRPGSYIAAIGAFAAVVGGATWTVLNVIDNQSVAITQPRKTMIGLAPLRGGGELSVVGRF